MHSSERLCSFQRGKNEKQTHFSVCIEQWTKINHDYSWEGRHRGALHTRNSSSKGNSQKNNLRDLPHSRPPHPRLSLLYTPVQFVLSGERERLKKLAKEKLQQAGWTDQLRQDCRGQFSQLRIHHRFEERVYHTSLKCLFVYFYWVFWLLNTFFFFLKFLQILPPALIIKIYHTKP